MKTTILVFTALMTLLSAAARAADEAPLTDVQKIVEKADIAAYYQGDDGKATVDMVITDKSGQQREREFIILRKDVKDLGDQLYYVYFQKPADVRRMTYLVQKHVKMGQDDDRWLYMPGLDLVKRIAASDKRTSFVGSHYLYEDVSGRSLEEDTHELIETTDDSYVVKNTPKKPDSVEFAHYNVTIDRKTFMPMKIEYFDKSGAKYRTIESKKVETIQGFPTVTHSVVTDERLGGKTDMKFSDVQYNLGLDDDIFTERYLRRPPREARR